MGDSELVRQPDLTVVVQAGGESRRMGRSKATVPFLGEPFILRNLRAFAPIAGELVVTTNEPENLGFIAQEFGEGVVRLERDLFEKRGALNGVVTAVSAARTPYVAIVAVDMAFASPQLVLAELAELKRTGADLAIPHLENGYEPFHAVYRVEACLPAMRDAVARDIIRAAGWFDESTDICEFDEQMVAEATGGEDCFANANTPTELQALEHRAVANM